MGKKTCLLEKEIIDSLKKGRLTQEIKKHLAVCPVCEEATAVYKWMSRFKDIGTRDKISLKQLPEAESIWHIAYAHRRGEKELARKALRPIVYARIASYVVFIIGMILLYSNFQEIKTFTVTNLGASRIFGSLLKTAVQLLPLFLIPMAIVIFWLLLMGIVSAFEKSAA